MYNTLIVEVAAMSATAGIAAACVAAFLLRGRKAQEEEVVAEITLEEGLAALRQVISAAQAAEADAQAAEVAAEAAAAKAADARANADALAAKAADATSRIALMEEALRA